MRMIFSLLILVNFSTSAFAAEKKDRFPAPTQPKSQFLIESERLKVLEETTVQKPRDPSRRLYGLSYGVLTAEKLNVFANERTVSYGSADHPALGAEIGYFPVYLSGYWGVLGGVQYSYMEGDSEVRTALHWISADASLAFRYEVTDRAYLKPFAALGVGSAVLVQRGPSYYNTSEARTVTLGTLGANLNLSRIFRLDSPLIWELTARYRRVWAPADNNLDFNGNQYALGVELAL